MSLNVNKTREDFPALQQSIKGRPPIYLDNACMTMRPKQVIEAMNEYYYSYPACGERSQHAWGKRVTDKVNESRKIISGFINSRKEEEIIFTKNTTEGLNIVANSFDFGKKNTVLLSEKEHNSNLLPWLRLKQQDKINISFVKWDDNKGGFDVEDFKSKVKNAGLVSVVWTSNMDGSSSPVEKIVKISHENKVPVMLDGAQAVPHKTVDVKKLDVDFLAFSGHKMLGPTGMGALYGKKEMLERLSGLAVGGGTVFDSKYDSMVWEHLPERLEPGLQNYAGIIGMAAAAEYLKKIGMKDIESHEKKLNKMATDGLLNAGATILGPKDAELRSGIASFNIKGMDFHTLAIMLNESKNIMIRSGRHCVHSWFNANNVEGSARASFYLYNSEEEVKIFNEEIMKIARMAK